MKMKLTPEVRENAIKHIAKMLKSDIRTWEYPNAQQEIFSGWNGCFSPINRIAFIETFGKQETAEMEVEAATLNATEAEMRSKLNIVQFRENAAANEMKSATELNVGDFLTCLDVGLKFEGGFSGHIKDFISDYKVSPRLVKITRIEEVAADFFDNDTCLDNWKTSLSEGGAEADESEEVVQEFAKNRDYSIYYTLCVLVRDPMGRCVLIDPEGFDYPRYVLLRTNWRDMFATVLKGLEAKRETAAA